MTYGELKKQLKKIGCYIEREGKSHEIWFSPITGESFPVGRHKTEEVKSGVNFSQTLQNALIERLNA